MTPKLIVCDIEGCLMPADKGAAWPESLAPIAEYCRKAQEDKNLPPLVLCTGRQAPYAECLAQVTGAFFPGFPSIVENGAFLYDIAQNKIIPSPFISAEMQSRRGELITKLGPWLAQKNAVLEAGKDICISLNPPANQSIEDFFEQVNIFLKDNLSGFTITHSRSAVDITPAGIDKAHGILELTKLTGIDPTQMLGIGDTTGDLPMLKLVGHPACPANATDDVKSVCKYVAKENEAKGVIEIIRHFVE